MLLLTCNGSNRWRGCIVDLSEILWRRNYDVIGVIMLCTMHFIWDIICSAKVQSIPRRVALDCVRTKLFTPCISELRIRRTYPGMCFCTCRYSSLVESNLLTTEIIVMSLLFMVVSHLSLFHCKMTCLPLAPRWNSAYILTSKSSRWRWRWTITTRQVAEWISSSHESTEEEDDDEECKLIDNSYS